MSRRLARAWVVLVLALAATCCARVGVAHPIDSVSLLLIETTPNRFLLKWQANSPSLGEQPPAPFGFRSLAGCRARTWTAAPRGWPAPSSFLAWKARWAT